MNIFEAIIQGIVQGLTEFLPVSSSGHLAISQHILGAGEDNLFFNVMLHLGTLIAVVAVYFRLIINLVKEFFLLIKDIFTGKFKWSEMNRERRLIFMLVIGLLPLFLLFVPLPNFVGSKNGHDLADALSSNITVVGFSLLATSILLTLASLAGKRRRKEKEELSAPDALFVGVMQCVAAVFPGLSRSGSTLSVGQMRGVSKQAALDFTFVLAIPSILAAALLEGKDALEAPGGIGVSIPAIIAGIITSALVGVLSIKLFKWLLKKDRMIIFIIYTALVGIAVLIISIIEARTGVNLFTGSKL